MGAGSVWHLLTPRGCKFEAIDFKIDFILFFHACDRPHPVITLVAGPSCGKKRGRATTGSMTSLGWKKGHNETCQCNICVILPGTIVRRMIQPGFSRESAYLNEHWKGISRGRFPFRALHCNMRITKAMFYNICQNALAAGDPAVARLNSAMELIGLTSKKSFRKSECSTVKIMSACPSWATRRCSL